MPHPGAPPLKRKTLKSNSPKPPRKPKIRIVTVESLIKRRRKRAPYWQHNERLVAAFDEAERKIRRTMLVRQRWRSAERKYNLEAGALVAMLERQNYSCVACFRSQKALGKSLCLDHCHKTGKARSFLCGDCNFALGFVRDDPELLRRLAVYLEVHAGTYFDPPIK